MNGNGHKAPLLSIVTPSYNQGQFIGEAIESVLSQSFESFEYLIVDGGSTDQSVNVIKSFGDRIDYWVSEPDEGQSHAINKGFRRARGQLVAWLNADDLYLPDAFSAISEAFEVNPAGSFYYGNGYRGDESGKQIASFFEQGTPAFTFDGLAYGLNYILQPSTFIGHRALKQIDYLNETLHYGMDSDLWLRLATLAEPVALAKHISVSREYQDTKTSTGSFERVEELRQISKAHTGQEITPGVILYYLDCLNSTIAQSRESGADTFSPEFQQELLKFWAQASKQLHPFGLGSNGIPTKVMSDG